MPKHDWDEHYVAGEIPWDTGEPDENLVKLIAAGRVPKGGRIIEIGCGTGTNALWLAEQGFNVVGCDISPHAIEQAKAKQGDAPRCRFVTLDFLADPLPEGPFDMAFDRGVFHVFDEAADRARFAERVAKLLTTSALWASAIGSTEGPPRDHGPPRRSLRDIAEAIEPWLEIVEVRSMTFTANIPTPAAAWWVVARTREAPAQPSTQRA